MLTERGITGLAGAEGANTPVIIAAARMNEQDFRPVFMLTTPHDWHGHVEHDSGRAALPQCILHKPFLMNFG
jgi:hypothetical protein